MRKYVTKRSNANANGQMGTGHFGKNSQMDLVIINEVLKVQTQNQYLSSFSTF